MGHGDQAHVLAEGGDGGAAEHAAGEGGGKTVHAQGAGDLLHGDVPAQAAGAAGRGVADGLHRRNDEHQAEGQNGPQLELGLEGKQLGHRHNAQFPDGAAHTGEVHHAEEDGHHIAHHHAQQDIQLFGDALEGGVKNEGGGKGDGGHQQVLPGAQGIGRGGAEGGHAHIQDAQSDGHHHAGRDDGRDESAPVLGRQTQDTLKAAAYDDGPHHDAVVLGGRGQAGRQKGKADAHDHRQTGADLPDGVQLEQRADAGDKHTVLQQPRRFHRRKGLAVVHSHGRNDDKGRDVGHEHGQHVLQAKGNGLGDGYASLQPVDVFDPGLLRCFFHTISPFVRLPNQTIRRSRTRKGPQKLPAAVWCLVPVSSIVLFPAVFNMNFTVRWYLLTSARGGDSEFALLNDSPKRNRTSVWMSCFFLELLTRFELVTSSLPRDFWRFL